MRILYLVALLVASVHCITYSKNGEREGERLETRADGPISVSINSATINGFVLDGVATFLGIPFASQSRFAQSKLLTPTSFSATTMGPFCTQTDSSNNIIGQEDCLNINIWAPASATSSSNLPVLVWIYGGGFIEGYASNPLYDLHNLASYSGNAVLVSFNYRVGPFGFFSEPTTPGGNWGLGDQIIALTWVQKYISYFGGNPKSVTLFGESAGGLSVCYLINSQLSVSLFHGAVIDAGNCGAPLRTPAAQQVFSGYLIAQLQCNGTEMDQFKCLQSQTTAQIMNANIAIGGTQIFGKYGTPLWQPFLDGIVLSVQPLINFRQGSFPNRVPIVMGSTTGSMSVFVAGNPYLTATNQAQLDGIIAAFLAPLEASNLMNQQAFAPITSYYSDVSNFGGDYTQAGISFLSDGVFVCGSKIEAGLFAQAQLTTYYWVWNHTIDCYSLATQGICTPLSSIFGPFTPYLGAFHGSDLGFWFNTSFFGPGEASIATSMMNILLSFTSTGTPSGPVPWSPISDYANPWPLFLQQDPVVAPFNQYPCSLWAAAYSTQPSFITYIGSPAPSYSRYYDIAIVVACAFVVSLLGVVIYFAYQGHVIMMRKRKAEGVSLLSRTPS